MKLTREHICKLIIINDIYIKNNMIDFTLEAKSCSTVVYFCILCRLQSKKWRVYIKQITMKNRIN